MTDEDTIQRQNSIDLAASCSLWCESNTDSARASCVLVSRQSYLVISSDPIQPSCGFVGNARGYC